MHSFLSLVAGNSAVPNVSVGVPAGIKGETHVVDALATHLSTDADMEATFADVFDLGTDIATPLPPSQSSSAEESADAEAEHQDSQSQKPDAKSETDTPDQVVLEEPKTDEPAVEKTSGSSMVSLSTEMAKIDHNATASPVDRIAKDIADHHHLPTLATPLELQRAVQNAEVRLPIAPPNEHSEPSVKPTRVALNIIHENTAIARVATSPMAAATESRESIEPQKKSILNHPIEQQSLLQTKISLKPQEAVRASDTSSPLQTLTALPIKKAGLPTHPSLKAVNLETLNSSIKESSESKGVSANPIQVAPPVDRRLVPRESSKRSQASDQAQNTLAMTTANPTKLNRSASHHTKTSIDHSAAVDSNTSRSKRAVDPAPSKIFEDAPRNANLPVLGTQKPLKGSTPHSPAPPLEVSASPDKFAANTGQPLPKAPATENPLPTTVQTSQSTATSPHSAIAVSVQSQLEPRLERRKDRADFAARLSTPASEASFAKPILHTIPTASQNLPFSVADQRLTPTLHREKPTPLSSIAEVDPFGISRTEQAAPASTITQPLPARLDHPAHIARQIAEAVQQTPNRPVEITLNPEELGRVRLSLSASDAGMVVTVLAERPETLDLLRRHITILGQEFQALGYADIAFSFAGRGDGKEQTSTEKDSDSNDTTTISNATVDEITQTQTPIASDTGLDLRL